MGFRLLGGLLWSLPLLAVAAWVTVEGWWEPVLQLAVVLTLATLLVLFTAACWVWGKVLIDKGTKRANERYFAKMSAREREQYALLQKQMAEDYSAARENS